MLHVPQRVFLFGVGCDRRTDWYGRVSCALCATVLLQMGEALELYEAGISMLRRLHGTEDVRALAVARGNLGMAPHPTSPHSDTCTPAWKPPHGPSPNPTALGRARAHECAGCAH
jgi:hypothetical protein